MKQSVGVIDCGVGNLFSVESALKSLRCNTVFAQSPEQLEGLDKVILPGVGAFPAGMAQLNKRGFTPWLRDYAGRGGHLLGICLGMQLLLKTGYEGERCDGVGLIDGEVVNLVPTAQCRVPHMGWNDVFGGDMADMPIFSGIEPHSAFYFVHSYYASLSANASESVATVYTDYCEREIVVGYQKDNVFGVQFHPEKSQKVGIKLLKNFLGYSAEAV